ncbi:hypothetical protein EJB05_47718, partial [Eragrostis curvula]
PAMADSSSSSLSSLLGDDERRTSPIPYRVKPLEYEPPIECKCKKKAAMWISWSDDNPGRRYLKCFKARDGGCDFIGWFEGPHHPFVQTLLIDLRDAVWSLKKQKASLRQAVAELVEKVEGLEDKVDELKEENARLDGFEGEKEYLEGKVERLEREKKLMRVLCAVLFVVAVFLRFG